MRSRRKKNLFAILFAIVITVSMCMNMTAQAQEMKDATEQSVETKDEDTDKEGLEEESKNLQPQAAGSAELVGNDTKEMEELDVDARQSGQDIPWIVGREIDDSGNVTWPKGVSYDSSTNTLTLNNVILNINRDIDWYPEFISYKGREKLVIKLLGKNVFKYVGDGMEPAAIREKHGAQADLLMTGSGSLELQGGSLIWDQSYNGDAGDLYIDGVTLISDGEGFMSQYSNIAIKNATINIKSKGDGFYSGGTFGICTGRIDGNGDDVPDEDKIYEGTLTVENSNIDIKNCTYPLAVNKINLIRCSLYGGETSLEYKANLNYVDLYDDVPGGRRIVYTDSYMRISTTDLKLPGVFGLSKAYDKDDKSDCSIWIPDFEVAGRTVNVEVKLETGYRLKNLYVNGKAISGTSFVMPEKDTTVKAVFEKIKNNSGQSKVLVSKITVSGISKKIAAGRKVKLTAKVYPSKSSNKAVRWKSSNTKVAKVDKSGVVTMNKNSGGKSVTITATAADGSKVKATYKLISMKGVVKKVSISSKTVVKAGKTLKLKAKVTASKSANKKLKWTSSNKKYATVSSSGKVKALKAGKGKKVKITAMATDGSDKKNTVTIKIK